MTVKHLIAEDFAPERLRALGRIDHDAYVSAEPWPHIVRHDLFSKDVLDDLVRELDSVRRESLLQHVTSRTVKNESAAVRGIGPTMDAFQAAMDSPAMTSYVEAVTGITGLVGDPTRELAGLHETPAGGFTKVHTDFSNHPTTGLHHRVNVLLYMNPEWPDDWGGQLELWPSDMDGDPKIVQPTLGTFIVFATNDNTKHGLPRAVACPEGRSRKSLAFYYYSVERHGDELSARHSSYHARPTESASDLIPPLKERLIERLPPSLVSSVFRFKSALRRK